MFMDNVYANRFSPIYNELNILIWRKFTISFLFHFFLDSIILFTRKSNYYSINIKITFLEHQRVLDF